MKGRLRIEIKGNQGKEGCICRHHRVLYRMGRTELKSRAELNNVRDPHMVARPRNYCGIMIRKWLADRWMISSSSFNDRVWP